MFGSTNRHVFERVCSSTERGQWLRNKVEGEDVTKCDGEQPSVVSTMQTFIKVCFLCR